MHQNYIIRRNAMEMLKGVDIDQMEEWENSNAMISNEMGGMRVHFF